MDTATCKACGATMPARTAAGRPRKLCSGCCPGRPRKPVDELQTSSDGKVNVEEAIRLRASTPPWSWARLAKRYGCSRQWVQKCVTTYQTRKQGDDARWA